MIMPRHDRGPDSPSDRGTLSHNTEAIALALPAGSGPALLPIAAGAGTTSVLGATEDSLTYPGWRVVAGAFLQSLAAFFVAYSFAAFATSIEAVLHTSRAEVVAIYGLYTALMLGLAPLGGLVADRFGTRAACLIGTVLMTTGLLLAAQSSSLGELHLFYGAMVGVGLAFVYTPCFAVVPRWFSARRGLASGIAASGAAVGTMLGVPLCAALVAAFGWEMALSAVAIGLLALGGLGALMLKEAPARSGAVAGPSLREVVLTSRFARLLVGNLLSAFAILVPLAQLVPDAQSQGLDASLVVYLMTIVGIGSLAGRILLGSLADRIGRTRSLALLLMALGASFGLWAMSDGLLMLALFALLYGTVYGAIIALRAAVAVDNFPCRSMTTLTGLLNSGMCVGVLSGTMLLGFAFDWTGSYTVGILVTGAIAATAGFLILPLARTAGGR